jgi:hypothetical protein
MLRFGLLMGVLGLGLSGCDSVGDDSEPSAGARAGVPASGGQAPSPGGTSSTAAGGSSQEGPNGGAGASHAASGLEWGEPVAKLCDDLWFVTIIDDAHVFEGCFESQEVDYNLVEQFTLRQLTDSTATLIASSETPIRMLTMDEKGYFVQQFQDFEGKSAFGGDIRRLAFGATELAPFYDLGGNDEPSIAMQTDAACVISQPSQDGYLNAVKYFASVVIADKVTAQKRTVFPTTEGSFITSWLDGNNVWFVIKLPEGPFEYHVPLAAGVATKGPALPNLCTNFLHRADGFLAVCGSEGDLVQIDSNGKQTKLTTGVQSWDELHDFDRVYWSSLDSIGAQVQGATLHAVDAAGLVSELKLSGDVFVEGLTPRFAYVSVRDATGAWLRRAPLADVK